jgi:hypothetical protein
MMSTGMIITGTTMRMIITMRTGIMGTITMITGMRMIMIIHMTTGITSIPTVMRAVTKADRERGGEP